MSIVSVSPQPLPSKQYALSALLALLALELLAMTGLGVPHLQTLLARSWNAADAVHWFAPVAAAWLLLYACGHARRSELLVCAGAATAVALLAVAGVGPAWGVQQPLPTALGAAALLAFAHLLLLSRQADAATLNNSTAERAVTARELLWLCLLFVFFDLLLQQLGNFTIVLHPGTHDADVDFTKQVQARALEKGLLLLTCGVYNNVIRFLFPLTISDAVLDEGKPLHALLRDVVPYPQVLLNVRVREKPDLRQHPVIGPAVGEAESALDGSGRVLLRYSGTEPLARVMVEGKDAEVVRRHAERLCEVIRRELGA